MVLVFPNIVGDRLGRFHHRFYYYYYVFIVLLHLTLPDCLYRSSKTANKNKSPYRFFILSSRPNVIWFGIFLPISRCIFRSVVSLIYLRCSSWFTICFVSRRFHRWLSNVYFSSAEQSVSSVWIPCYYISTTCGTFEKTKPKTDAATPNKTNRHSPMAQRRWLNKMVIL